MPWRLLSWADPRELPMKASAYRYIPGAGDDEETWAQGLEASTFWRHVSEILQPGPLGLEARAAAFQRASRNAPGHSAYTAPAPLDAVPPEATTATAAAGPQSEDRDHESSAYARRAPQRAPRHRAGVPPMPVPPCMRRYPLYMPTYCTCTYVPPRWAVATWRSSACVCSVLPVLWRRRRRPPRIHRHTQAHADSRLRHAARHTHSPSHPGPCMSPASHALCLYLNCSRQHAHTHTRMQLRCQQTSTTSARAAAPHRTSFASARSARGSSALARPVWRLRLRRPCTRGSPPTFPPPLRRPRRAGPVMRRGGRLRRRRSRRRLGSVRAPQMTRARAAAALRQCSGAPASARSLTCVRLVANPVRLLTSSPHFRYFVCAWLDLALNKEQSQSRHMSATFLVELVLREDRPQNVNASCGIQWL